MEWLLDPQVLASFVSLVVLEIILGIDNLVFLSLLAGRLPAAQRDSARRIGLALALATRLALLGSIAWLIHLTQPVLSLAGHGFSWRDLVLIGGGGFLLYKSTREIHLNVDGADEAPGLKRTKVSFVGTVIQIALLDIIFSLDSVITAVGIADQVSVMVAAISVAMFVMLIASNPLASFIERHASIKMLALSFLLLVGTMLLADGFGFHVPRGYIYAAMGFSVMVEMLNLLSARRRTSRAQTSKNETDASSLAGDPR